MESYAVLQEKTFSSQAGSLPIRQKRRFFAVSGRNGLKEISCTRKHHQASR